MTNPNIQHINSFLTINIKNGSLKDKWRPQVMRTQRSREGSEWKADYVRCHECSGTMPWTGPVAEPVEDTLCTLTPRRRPLSLVKAVPEFIEGASDCTWIRSKCQYLGHDPVEGARVLKTTASKPNLARKGVGSGSLQAMTRSGFVLSLQGWISSGTYLSFGRSWLS